MLELQVHTQSLLSAGARKSGCLKAAWGGVRREKKRGRTPRQLHGPYPFNTSKSCPFCRSGTVPSYMSDALRQKRMGICMYMYVYMHRRRGVERARWAPEVHPRGIGMWKTLTSNTFAIRFKQSLKHMTPRVFGTGAHSGVLDIWTSSEAQPQEYRDLGLSECVRAAWASAAPDSGP